MILTITYPNSDWKKLSYTINSCSRDTIKVALTNIEHHFLHGVFRVDRADAFSNEIEYEVFYG